MTIWARKTFIDALNCLKYFILCEKCVFKFKNKHNINILVVLFYLVSEEYDFRYVFESFFQNLYYLYLYNS